MFSSMDKAIVALIMAILFILNNLFGIELGLNETTINSILSVILPFAVYFFPNRGPSDKALEAAKQIDKQIPASAPVTIKTASGQPDIHIPGKL